MTGGKFIIDVTQEVIDDSIQRDSSHCMIAEAVKQAVPDAGYVSADLQTIRFTHKKLRRRYVFLTPRRAQVELINFDQGVKPKPFSIQLQRGQVVKMDERKRNGKKPKEAAAAVEPVQLTEPTEIVESSNELTEQPAVKKKRPYKRAEIKNADHDSRAQKIGGQAPPTGALSTSKGRERRFGLKTLAE